MSQHHITPRQWATYLMATVCLTGTLEALLITAVTEDANAPLRTILFYLGALAPLIALTGILGWWSARSWRALMEKHEEAATSGDAPKHTATWLTGACLIALTVAIATPVGPIILNTIRTPWMASMAILLVMASTGVLALLIIGPLLHRSLTTVLTLIADRAPPLTPVVNSVVATIMWLFVSGSVVSWVLMLIKRDLVAQTPWWSIVAVQCSAILMIVIHAIKQRLWPNTTSSWGHRLRWPALIVGVIAGAGLCIASWMGITSNAAVQETVAQSGITPTLVHGAQQKLDGDGDGSAAWLGGGDCDPGDKNISPSAYDIPEDGIDQDCSGTDAMRLARAYNHGKKKHPVPPGAPKRPHVILITTDALSFAHTTPGGYKRDVTPHLNAFTKRATTFPHAFSMASSTRFALPGLLTGQFNSQLALGKRRSWPFPWSKSTYTMAEMFKSKGWRTVQVIGNRYLTRGKWKGLHQGFDVIDTTSLTPPKTPHTGKRVTDAALSQIAQHKKNTPNKPLFLWAHYFDHHAPYIVPKGGKSFGTSEIDRYDAEVHATDLHWKRLFETIEKTWKPDEYILIFTADHGERFDGRGHHGITLRTDVLDVPFIVQTNARRGERVEGLVGHMDLLPTLANLIGVKPKPYWQGESLLPVWFSEGKRPEKQVLYALHYRPEKKKKAFQKLSVRTDTLYVDTDLLKNKTKLYKWDRRKKNLKFKPTTEAEKDATDNLKQLIKEKSRELRQSERGLMRKTALNARKKKKRVEKN